MFRNCFVNLSEHLRWLLGGRLVFALLLATAFVPLGCIKTRPTTEQPAAATKLASMVVDAARPQLKAVYETAAKAVQYDGTLSAPRLRSTMDVAEYVERLNEYAWLGPNKLKTDEFSAELDRRWLAAVGKEDRPLTPELRLLASGVLQGVANDL